MTDTDVDEAVLIGYWVFVLKEIRVANFLKVETPVRFVNKINPFFIVSYKICKHRRLGIQNFQKISRTQAKRIKFRFSN